MQGTEGEIPDENGPDRLRVECIAAQRKAANRRG